MIQLSILIPSIPEREELFSSLTDELFHQKNQCMYLHPGLGDVEICADRDSSFLNGGPSIGEKRNRLVKSASGKYLAFLDDDEDIAPNYIESLLRLCLQDQDICTFRAMTKLQNFWALVDMRLMYKVNDQISPDYTVRRPPWHICPVRSVYAKSFEFKDINNAEDFEWMERVLSCCTTEAHTDQILFCYQHGPHSEADKIPL